MFDVVENEAQLAAVLGHEIAHSIQEHSWLQSQYHKKSLMTLRLGAAFASAYGLRSVAYNANMVEGAIRNGYSRALENQADRLGLEYMVNAGYDPRQAPQVWKEMTKKFGLQPTDFFWSNHDDNATRRSYLMNELKNNYTELDYGRLKIEEPHLKAMAEAVRTASNGKRKIRVTK